MDVMRSRIRQLREERGENQGEVAKALHVSRSALSTYENGITPPMNTCIEIAKYYDVSLDYLLGISPERRPAGGNLASAFASLFNTAKEAAPTSTELTDLLETALKYYSKGAPCGDLPLLALRGFIDGLRAAMAAATSGDTPALINGANAAAVAALEVTKMPAALYESQKEGTKA